MNQMNTLPDLNLLRVFLSIWDLRSLTAAGERLRLTQPAVSHALRRLRVTLDDPLFVRSSNVMVPTGAATRLHPPLEAAFSLIQRAMQEHGGFDPATARRVFRLSMSDMSESFYLPPLLARLQESAPSIRLEIVRLDPPTVAAGMRAGDIDAAIGYLPGLDDSVSSQSLFVDRFVCMVRAGHPFRGRTLSTADLAAFRYVYAGVQATGHQMIEQWLADSGIQRRIVLRLAHFTTAPDVVRATDLAVIYPESVARRVNYARAFRLLPLPNAMPAVEVKLHTHPHFAGDLGISWLRETLLEMFVSPVAATAPRVGPLPRPRHFLRTGVTAD